MSVLLGQQFHFSHGLRFFNVKAVRGCNAQERRLSNDVGESAAGKEGRFSPANRRRLACR
jgi:hypothetical protein